MAPDPLTRQPKGQIPFWARARRLLWSWWVWALLFLWHMGHDAWGWAAGTGAMALVSYLITPSEFPPRYGLDHEFAIDDEEFLPTMTGATGVPCVPGNRIDILNNGDQFYPAMLEAIAHAEVSITIEAYIYWAGDIGLQVRRGAGGQGRGGPPGQDPARRGRLDQDRRRDPDGPRSAAAASSPGTTRSGTTASAASTTARTASR